MGATIDFCSLAELNPELANSKTQKKVDLAFKRGTYNVRIVDKDTGKTIYPAVPAYSVPEILRVLNEKDEG